MTAKGFDTIGHALDRAGGRPSGFDYMRIALSVAVLVWHSYRVVDASHGWYGWWRAPVGLILPMFFALSGFLVAGSLLRVRSIHEFITLRAIRILPALVVEVALSALVIGLVFTTLPVREYLADPVFHRYFLNILGIIHYQLPGVFQTNPLTPVNISLWTIPFELKCYLLIIGFWVLGAIRNPRLLLPMIIAAQLIAPFLGSAGSIPVKANGAVSGYILVLTFAFGVALYIHRHRVPLRADWAMAALALSLVLLLNGRSAFFCPLPAAYVTVWLGLRTPRRSAFIDSGDYSYGIYLYAFPIQQALVALLPAWRTPWVNAPLALAGATVMAMLSWHLVEKPVLGRRRAIIGHVDDIAVRIRLQIVRFWPQ
jgi:peptidoglycan/LPS O-acetylase OafA/YrhL